MEKEDKDRPYDAGDIISAIVSLLLIVAFFALVTWLLAEAGVKEVHLPWSVS